MSPINLDDLVARYTISGQNYTVTLPDEPPTVLEFRRVRNSAEMAAIKRDALAWAEDARALATDPLAREALGELVGEDGLGRIVQACIMAETIVGNPDPVVSRRYAFCKMAAFAGPYFDIIQQQVTLSYVSESFLQLEDAHEGKGDSAQTKASDQS